MSSRQCAGHGSWLTVLQGSILDSLPKVAPPRVVPVNLAQVARQASSDFLKDGERLLSIALREHLLPATLVQVRPCLSRAPRPLALPRLVSDLNGFLYQGAGTLIVAP